MTEVTVVGFCVSGQGTEVSVQVETVMSVVEKIVDVVISTSDVNAYDDGTGEVSIGKIEEVPYVGATRVVWRPVLARA